MIPNLDHISTDDTENAKSLQSSLTLAVGDGAKAEAEATMARVQAAVNFMVNDSKMQGMNGRMLTTYVEARSKMSSRRYASGFLQSRQLGHDGEG
jgi:hypothetical protein